jgi:hypothetical protein
MSQNDSLGLPIGFLDVLTVEGRKAILNTNHYNGCDLATVQPLTVGETDYYVQHYIFPIQVKNINRKYYTIFMSTN